MLKTIPLFVLVSLGLAGHALADEGLKCAIAASNAILSPQAAQLTSAAIPEVSDMSIPFSAATAYFSGRTLATQSPGFRTGTSTGDLQLASEQGGPSGTLIRLTGVTANGSTITITAGDARKPCPWEKGLCSDVDGVISLTAKELKAAGLSENPRILALGMNLAVSGSSVEGGYADVCILRDTAGNCHGVQLNFIPR